MEQCVWEERGWFWMQHSLNYTFPQLYQSDHARGTTHWRKAIEGFLTDHVPNILGSRHVLCIADLHARLELVHGFYDRLQGWNM